jgi:hypothetical protein
MYHMDKKIILKITVLVTFLGMIGVNAMANLLPINNMTTGAISEMYQNLFAPAGITFSIWGLIYLLLGAYTLYQFGLFGKGKISEKTIEKISFYFILTSIANMLWIFAWHYNFILLSVGLIVTMLYYLIKIADITNKQEFNIIERVCVCAPFTIYFGWITVATIANITVFLVSINWDGFGISPVIWTIFILLVGTIIGILRMFKDVNPAYGLVFVWAYLGIWIKHTSPTGFNNMFPEIIYTVISLIVLLLIGIGFVGYKKLKILSP